MLDKEYLLKHIKDKENRQIVLKVLNKVEGVIKYHKVEYTDFYDPYQIANCKDVLDHIRDIQYIISGGYKEAERQIFIIYPQYMLEDDMKDPIGGLKIIGNFKREEISHRDFLGGILGLGLKREKIGDILVDDGQANIIAFKPICEYIQFHLEKISKYRVDVQAISLDELMEIPLNFKFIHGTVASLRLDAILAVGFGESRSSISRLIHGERVKVNWKFVKEPSYIVEEGDIISLKGKGRIILGEIGNKTKKDRCKVIIKKII